MEKVSEADKVTITRAEDLAAKASLQWDRLAMYSDQSWAADIITDAQTKEQEAERQLIDTVSGLRIKGVKANLQITEVVDGVKTRSSNYFKY